MATDVFKNMILRFAMILATVCLLKPATVHAQVTSERMSDPAGKSCTYTSDNGRYRVTITHGDNIASWSLKENDHELWNRTLWDEPGFASVSDNGSTIVLPIWGWRDEGGSSGMAIYDKEGNLIRQIMFGNASAENGMLRWIRKQAISPEGGMIVTGEGGIKQSTLTMFDTATGNVVWTRQTGPGEVMEIVVASKGSYSLAAARNNDNGSMAFTLLSRDGRTLWNTSIDANFSYDVKRYIRFSEDLHSFDVYELKARRYRTISLPVRIPG